jgi:hypothetical protein
MSCLKVSISPLDREVQALMETIEKVETLSEMMQLGWQLACGITIQVIEEVLAERAQRPTEWPECANCGRKLKSKGLVPRQLKSLIGIVRWNRRVGRCPKGCKVGQVVPLDTQLGLKSNQRAIYTLQRIACILAIFVPFEVASKMLDLLVRTKVSHGTIWNWVQTFGKQAINRLEVELETLREGKLPKLEPIEPEFAGLPLIIGADGVMVAFRPNPKTPKGKIVWKEVKVGLLTRLKQYRTGSGKETGKLIHRRLVAVLGDIDLLKPRLGLESVRQGILQTILVFWIRDGARGFWRLLTECFAKYAFGILDFYHAAQHVWT